MACFVELVISVGCKEHQVVEGIVGIVVVCMMDDFGSQKGSAQCLRHKQAVFHNIAVFAGHAQVFLWTTHILDRPITAMLSEISHTTLPRWVAFAHYLL